MQVTRKLMRMKWTICALLIISYAEAASGQRVETTIDWPGRDSRTLQEALDAVPDGGTLRIAPGSFQINQPLFVSNKLITIEGAGCPETPAGSDKCGNPDTTTTSTTSRATRFTHLIGPRRDTFVEARLSVGLFNFLNAGGTVRGLKLSGFDAGIVTLPFARDPASPARALTLRESCVRDAVRGVVLMAPAAFNIVKSRISAVMWNGISAGTAGQFTQVQGQEIVIEEAANACTVLGGGSFSFTNSVFSNCGQGGGITVTNGGTLTLVNSTVANNNGPGVSVLNNSHATIQQPLPIGNFMVINGNRIAGIFVKQSIAHIINTFIVHTLPTSDGKFGDGVLAVLSPGVFIQGTGIEDSDRSGVSVFGGFVQLSSTQIRCVAFHLNNETHLGLEGTFHDAGGNSCGCPEANAGCVSQSAGLEAPEPLPPVD